jgi:hypothetical protein
VTGKEPLFSLDITWTECVYMHIDTYMRFSGRLRASKGRYRALKVYYVISPASRAVFRTV